MLSSEHGTANAIMISVLSPVDLQRLDLSTVSYRPGTGLHGFPTPS